jgi:hypothetical protein
MHPKMIVQTAVSSLVLSPVLLCAQTPPSAVTLPLAGVHYRYWPEQLVQWIGPELPYSMIVLDVDGRGKEPVYDVELIFRSGKQLVHYTNSQTEEDIDRKAGFDVHRVAMTFDEPAEPDNGAQYLLRFNTEDGTPVVWQFVLGTEVSEQGSGLSPVPAPIPIIMYRGQGGLAGQGTALKVGEVTSVAEVWKQIARPPYFVPYRGALSVGVQILTFAPGSSVWKDKGAELESENGTSLEIGKDGQATTMTDVSLGTTAAYETSAAGVTHVTFGPAHGKREDTVSLEFSPGLCPGTQSRFVVMAGKKNRIAAGSVEMTQPATGPQNLAWSFDSPNDMKGKQALATARVEQ